MCVCADAVTTVLVTTLGFIKAALLRSLCSKQGEKFGELPVVGIAASACSELSLSHYKPATLEGPLGFMSCTEVHM